MEKQIPVWHSNSKRLSQHTKVNPMTNIHKTIANQELLFKLFSYFFICCDLVIVGVEHNLCTKHGKSHFKCQTICVILGQN